MALFLASFAFSWQATAPPAFITASGVTAQARAQFLVMQEDTPSEQPAAPTDEPATSSAPADAGNKQFDLKSMAKEESKKGAGFNQFDPVLSATTFVSRRFGLAGGLALVALLAATEGNEILKSITDTGPVVGSGELITTPSGLQYQDILIAARGDTPLPGSVIGFNAVVSIGGKVLFDTTSGKPVAFKYGQRPFQNVVCEGVEEGLKGMRPGAKRKLYVPAALAPAGVQVPEGVKLEYEIELLEVLPGYF